MTTSIADDIDTTITGHAKIKVIGVGGAGGNAVKQMIDSDLTGVQFICANTDAQALNKISAPLSIQLGEKLTGGLGAGANPEVGRDAAQESINAIRDAIGDANMVFVTAGMGKGTGTGAAPVIAQAAKELGALTVGVVTKPFGYEGVKKMHTAEQGLKKLKKYVDCLIIIPNDRLRAMTPQKTPLPQVLKKSDEVLFSAVRGISDVITQPGEINVDFADVRTIMSKVGMALMGSGRASGENRARDATSAAIMNPLLEEVSLESAKAILYNITASDQITADEVEEIGCLIAEAAGNDPDINIIFGIVYDDSMGDELQVTVIATGIEPMEPIQEEVISPARVTKFNKAAPKAAPVAPRPAPQLEETPAEQAEANIQRPRRRVTTETWYDDRIIRSPYAKNQERLLQQRGAHVPGREAMTFEGEDLEVPAFLRHQFD
ncbi:MAG: cell division protein FtsZ [Desulfovibrio sp.]|nr:cell division protein FtsZ [Desulfovibrio sp.]